MPWKEQVKKRLCYYYLVKLFLLQTVLNRQQVVEVNLYNLQH